MDKNIYAVIDIGGTKIALSLFKSDGKFLARKIIPTRVSAGPRDALSRIYAEAKNLLSSKGKSKSRIKKICVGCPGPFDYKSGKILDLPNLHSWKNFGLKSALSKKFKAPVVIENDANLAGLGEAALGSGKGFKRVLYITYSTGIGGGFTIGGSIYRGASGDAMEIGHMTVVKRGRKCGCGKYGCLEAMASGSAMEKAAKLLLKKNKKSRLYKFYKTEGKLDVGTIIKAMKLKDGTALKVWDEAIEYFSIGVANLIQTLNPDVIVIGGGVSKGWDFIKPRLTKHLGTYAWQRPLKAARIVRARLGDSAADWGGYVLLRGLSSRRA